MPDGKTAQVTVSFVGAANPTGLNLSYINESYFVGFAFQQDANQTENASTLDNYMRIDFQFSDPVELDEFLINDVDAFEVVQVEGWPLDPGTPGTGITASYALGDYLRPYSFDGIEGVTTKDTAPEYLTLDPESIMGVGFTYPIKAMSLYYSKQTQGGAGLITIGLEGNIKVSEALPRLYYTFNFTNEEDIPVEVEFDDVLPAGLVWDSSYAPVTSGGLEVSLAYSGGDTTAAATGMLLPPGSSTLTLRTLGVTQTGTIDNGATVTPGAGDPITASARITLE